MRGEEGGQEGDELRGGSGEIGVEMESVSEGGEEGVESGRLEWLSGEL